jgi:dipeptidyl aminopeptidase/acylaminoacyl peptidase
MKRWCAFWLAVACVSPTLAQNRRKDEAPELAAKRPFTFEDMMKLKRVNEPVPSPDGKWVVFSAVDVDLEANTRTPHIWIVPADGSAKERLLVATPQGEDRPRWSPDGKYLSFTASYDGSQQIWVAAFDSEFGSVTTTVSSGSGAARSSGDAVAVSGSTSMFSHEVIRSAPGAENPWARQMTSISTEADGQQWSPDGKKVLFVSSVYPECDKSPDYDVCNKQEDDKRSNLKVKAQIFTHLLYRHWKSYSTAKRSHLFVQPVKADGTPNGKAFDITPGDHDVPPFSLGGADMYAWSPDGKEVAYTSNIDEVEATSTNNDIFVVPVGEEVGGRRQEVGTHAKKISTSPGSDSTPLYSPDGKYIAYLSQARAGYESDRFRLMLYERATGKINELTKGFDRWVGSFTWAESPFVQGTFRVVDRIYVSAEEQGESPIYSIGIPNPGVYTVSNSGRQLLPSENQRGFLQKNPGLNLQTGITKVMSGHNDDLIESHGRLFFTRMTASAPNEIFTAELGVVDVCSDAVCDLHEAKPVTKMNSEVLAGTQMSKLEPFWFTGAAQTKVEGFITKPPGFNEHKKYPVKFLIHGGPQTMWGDSWTYRWNAQLFAANGYVVIQINPRGSTGYGQKFIDEINGDWSGKPITDLMMGLDYAIKKYPFIDGNRVCAMGASWGGYAVNWLIGHTNRFKCAVTHDGMFNTVSAYGTTEELWFPQWEFKGNPYTQLGRANYERVNPLNSVKNFKTPTLVSHGQLDYRLDLSEGLQLFTALQMQRVPSKMLYFPDEGHWVMKPQNSQLWYKTVNAWVDQWTANKQP